MVLRTLASAYTATQGLMCMVLLDRARVVYRMKYGVDEMLVYMVLLLVSMTDAVCTG